jgi:ribosomal protein L2
MQYPKGTWIHNIEWNPGQGAKLIRAAGTFAQIIKKFENTPQCIVRLPSGVDKLIDSRCRATIGIVSNLRHGKHKLHKAGQSRWLGVLAQTSNLSDLLCMECPVVFRVPQELMPSTAGLTLLAY